MTSYNLLLAGGGTAGHIEPALAVAREWQSRHPQSRITFLGTSEGLENTLIPQVGFTLHLIPKVAISRTLSPSLLKVPFQLVASIVRTMKELEGVDVAIGFGGYVSAPLYIAASLKRIPFVIHEQNARPGWANRMGAYLTRYVALSYPITSGRLRRAQVTGLPLRSDVVDVLRASENRWKEARMSAKSTLFSHYGFPADRPLLFIFGGSQGSQALNRVIAQSQESLHSFSIVHGVGQANELPPSTTTYKATHYISDMAQHYLAADLIIGRSGAVTCAEVDALGKFALFIPLPIGNGEQALNATELVKAGRAEVVAQESFTPTWLATNIERLMQMSKVQSDSGNTAGLHSVTKIADMIESALRG